jgi:hypothetical protein
LRVIISLSKKIEFCLGDAFIITGGIVSFSPPEGTPLFAHLFCKKRNSKQKTNKINFFIQL